jgi:hypothetical protein
MKSYIVLVKPQQHLPPLTYGNIVIGDSEGRSHAKIKAKQLVKESLGVDAIIISIAEGYVSVKQQSAWKNFDD